MATLGNLVMGLFVDSSPAEKGLDKFSKKVDKTASGFARKGFWLAGALVSGVTGIVSAALTGITSVMGGRMETAAIKMGLLSGSWNEGQRQLEYLRDTSTRTGASFESLFESYKKIIGAGVSDRTAIGLLKSIEGAGEILGGGAVGIRKAATAMASLLEGGQATREVLKDLNDEGLPVFRALAAEMTRVTGRVYSTQDAINALRRGTITSFTALKAIQDAADSPDARLAGQRFANSFEGQLNRLWANLVNTAGLAGKAFIDGVGITRLISWSNGFVRKLADIVEGAAGKLGLNLDPKDLKGAVDRAFENGQRAAIWMGKTLVNAAIDMAQIFDQIGIDFQKVADKIILALNQGQQLLAQGQNWGGNAAMVGGGWLAGQIVGGLVGGRKGARRGGWIGAGIGLAEIFMPGVAGLLAEAALGGLAALKGPDLLGKALGKNKLPNAKAAGRLGKAGGIAGLLASLGLDWLLNQDWGKAAPPPPPAPNGGLVQIAGVAGVAQQIVQNPLGALQGAAGGVGVMAQNGAFPAPPLNRFDQARKDANDFFDNLAKPPANWGAFAPLGKMMMGAQQFKQIEDAMGRLGLRGKDLVNQLMAVAEAELKRQANLEAFRKTSGEWIREQGEKVMTPFEKMNREIFMAAEEIKQFQGRWGDLTQEQQQYIQTITTRKQAGAIGEMLKEFSPGDSFIAQRADFGSAAAAESIIRGQFSESNLDPTARLEMVMKRAVILQDRQTEYQRQLLLAAQRAKVPNIAKF